MTRPAVSQATASRMLENARARHDKHVRLRRSALSGHLARQDLQLPEAYPLHVDRPDGRTYLLDVPMQSVLSEYVRRTDISLPALVELVRNQTTDDYRPNKDLVPALLRKVCKGYDNLEEMLHIVQEGVKVRLTGNAPVQLTRPKNHTSASVRINVLRKNLRKEQDAGRCLVLDLDLLSRWPEVIISPFGIVDKANSDPPTTGRTIHDLSFPVGLSINDRTDPTCVIKPSYQHCDAISAEILRVAEEHPDEDVELMAGDVSLAFRNVSLHSHSVHLFAGIIEEDNVLVIELAAPFGWTGSPGSYGVFGRAIAYVHGSHTSLTSPKGFFNYHWVDDHINVAADVGSSRNDMDRSLRYAMVCVLGSQAVNEEKFTRWSTQQKVLGLLFDTQARTVSMPADKIQKARDIVSSALTSPSLSRTDYRSLMGRLRHVATCIRAARPFLQRLRKRESELHRFHQVAISPPMKQDLQWWRLVLHSPHLNGVSLEFFNALPEPDVIVEMDASDYGLCALDISSHAFLTYQFSPDERQLISEFKSGTPNGFDINFRELLSCGFAVHAWGSHWFQRYSSLGRPCHVHFRIDNTTAVTWQNKMASRNPRAQVIIYLLSWWETKFHLRFSASHIAGVENTRADAGSRTSIPQHSRSYVDLANYLRAHSVADSTFTKYKSALAVWNAWASVHGFPNRLDGVAQNMQVKIISDFIVHASQHGFRSGPLRSDSIRGMLYGIRHFFAAEGHDFPITHPHISMLLKGISRLDSPRRRKAPVSLTLLETCFRSSLPFSEPFEQACWGVMCLAFFFLLRRSEIMAIDNVSFKWFALKAEDIAVVDKHGMATRSTADAHSVYIKLHGSKTNQAGSPISRMLTRSGHPFLCPVFGALLLLQSRGNLPMNIPAAVFTNRQGRPACISTSHVNSAIKAAAAISGEDPHQFSSHSLRAGGATHMYRSGADTLTIQFHGRWTSDAFKSYTRLCKESVQTLAPRMITGSRGNSTLQ